MPLTKNAFIRYKYIDDLLSDRHHYYSVQDLTDKVNERLSYDARKTVSKRCIEKDINALADSPFSVQFERFMKNGKHCIRYANPSYSIFTKEMSDEEANLLCEVLNTLGQFEGLDNFTWLDNFKIGLGLQERNKVISFSNNPYLKNSNMLGQLFDVISNEQVIELGYHTFTGKKDGHVVVYPYLLKQYNDRWYLLCAPEDNTGKILNFALDRIDIVTPLPERRYVKCQVDLEEHFDDIVGVTLYEGRKVDHILFWVSDNSLGYVDTKPIHGSQTHIIGDKESELRLRYSHLQGGAFFTLDCIKNHELIRELCAFGDNLIVLEDKDGIKEDIIKRIQDMMKKYTKNEH
jgi:predicted DNA-binding transcriptional regulator YafY